MSFNLNESTNMKETTTDQEWRLIWFPEQSFTFLTQKLQQQQPQLGRFQLLMDPWLLMPFSQACLCFALSSRPT